MVDRWEGSRGSVTGDVLTQPASQVVMLQYYHLTWYKKSAEQRWWIVRKGLEVLKLMSKGCGGAFWERSEGIGVPNVGIFHIRIHKKHRKCSAIVSSGNHLKLGST